MDKKLLVNTSTEIAKLVGIEFEQSSILYGTNAAALDTHKHGMYRTVVGRFMYLITRTRPDFAAAARILALHYNKPSKVQLVSSKQILRYLRGTVYYVI